MNRSRNAVDVPGGPRLGCLERPLEREEEAELARRWQHSRDRSAADRLMRAEAGRVFAAGIRLATYAESKTKQKLRARIPELGDGAVNEWIAQRLLRHLQHREC